MTKNQKRTENRKLLRDTRNFLVQIYLSKQPNPFGTRKQFRQTVRRCKKTLLKKRPPIFKPIPLVAPFPGTEMVPHKKGVSMNNKIYKALKASQARRQGALAWRPSPSLQELAKSLGIKLSKSGQLVLETIGSSETLDESLQGFPIQALISQDGNPSKDFCPQIALEVDSNEELEECWIKLASKGDVKFISANKGWNGPASIMEMFGANGGARAYASLGSTNVKGCYSTKNSNIQTFIVNLSDREKMNVWMEDHKELVKSKDQFLKWLSQGPETIDGMSICGKAAMPVVQDGKKPSRCQFRAVNTESPERLSKLKEIDRNWVEAVKTMMKEYGQDEWVEAYNLATKKCGEIVEATRGEAIARYGKGLLVEMGFLNPNVLLIDVNAIKCVQRSKILSLVNEKGYWEANELLIGALQDYGTGYMKLSWQAIMYFLEKLPNDFPVEVFSKRTGKIEKMGGRNGFGPAIGRFFNKFEESIKLFGKGVLDSNMKKILEFILREELTIGKEDSDRLILALWNNKIVRKEVCRYLMNFLRKFKFAFITEGMDILGDILPRKKYAMDAKSLPGLDKLWNLQIHDQTIKVCPIYIKDNAMWDKLGVYDLPFVLFKHPVSDKRVVDVVIALDPRCYYSGDLEMTDGIWFNPDVIKLKFTGDSDGDMFGYFPLMCTINEVSNENWKLEQNKDGLYPEDYCVLYSVSQRSFNLNINPTNVEDYTKNAKSKPIGYSLGEAEAIMGMSQKLVGSTALLQGQVIRLHDHYLRGVLVPKNDATSNELTELVEILETLRQEVAAILELSISMQKKELSEAFLTAFNKMLFEKNYKSELWMQLVSCVVIGKHDYLDEENNVNSEVAIAVRDRAVCKFANGSTAIDGRVWSTATSRMLAEFLSKNTIGTINKSQWQEIMFAKDGESTSRFSDMERDEDPEFSFGSHANMNWGIFPASNLSDCLAEWNKMFCARASEIKALVEGWFPKWQDVTNANRCVHNTQWKHIAPEINVDSNLFNSYVNLYKTKFVWSTLGLKVGDYKEPQNPIRSEMAVEMARFAGRVTSPEATWLFYTFLRSRDGISTENFSKGFIHQTTMEAFAKLWRNIPVGPIEKQEDAETLATRLVEELKSAIRPNFGDTIFEWMFGRMGGEFVNKFFHLIWSAIVIIARIKKPNYIFSPRRGSQKSEWNLLKYYKAQLHPEAVRAIPMIILFSGWQPAEQDFRELMGINKNLRPNMKSIKAPWRVSCNQTWDSLTPEQQINCWRIAFDAPMISKILNEGKLPKYEIWNRTRDGGADAWLRFQSGEIESEPKLVETQEFFFSTWGYEAMQEHGLKHSDVVGDVVAKPRIPVLLIPGLDLSKPITVTTNPICRGNGKKDFHATELIQDGKVIGLICESIVVMRWVLAFDRLTLKRIQRKDNKPDGSFIPVENFWKTCNPGYERFVVQLEGYNLTLEEQLENILEEVKSEI